VKVVFSHDAFRMQRFGGVSRYFARLHAGLRERGPDSQILAALHINAHLHGLPGVCGVDAGGWRPRRAVKGMTKILDPVLEIACRRGLSSDAIYHATYYNARSVPHRPFVVTVYDMIHELHAGDFRPDDPTAARKAAMCKAADLVITISERTRRDLLERVALPTERVIVTPLGVDQPSRPRPDGSRQQQSTQLLFVGDRTRRYKNFSTLLEAMARVDATIRLECFGGAPTEAELAAIDRLGLHDRVRWRSGDDDALLAAYGAARAVVCPSLLEGFGLPVLEAMANGCVVVCSQLDVFREVHGGVALEFDPDDVESMAAAVSSAFGDDDRWSQLRARGFDRAAMFSWASTVEQTIEAYQALVQRQIR
jgi:glycosyltransferase involved in cell wall biosynthesis